MDWKFKFYLSIYLFLSTAFIATKIENALRFAFNGFSLSLRVSSIRWKWFRPVGESITSWPLSFFKKPKRVEIGSASDAARSINNLASPLSSSSSAIIICHDDDHLFSSSSCLDFGRMLGRSAEEKHGVLFFFFFPYLLYIYIYIQLFKQSGEEGNK